MKFNQVGHLWNLYNIVVWRYKNFITIPGKCDCETCIWGK